MTLLLISIAILIAGYLFYGLLIEKILRINPRRTTPAYTHNDGVDYMPLPTWRVFLIQFLNIAGIGPIFGAIMGVMFGPAAFLWIVFGTIFAGAVHDFVAAHMSLRANGASLPQIIGKELGTTTARFVIIFTTVLLILVGAVFVKTPAALLANLTGLDIAYFIGAIFGYYILATLLPVDRLIARIYPLFGAALLFMAIGLLGYMIIGHVDIPHQMGNFSGTNSSASVFPMMFVSIACGAISGFHATQSPMMARCLTNEKHARPIFYGAMIAEGLVALIWAAAAIAFTGGYDQLGQYMAGHQNNAAALVKDVSFEWLGVVGGIMAILGVIAAPITTGDTALRSARLITADQFKISQKPILKRLAISLPIFALTFTLLFVDFTMLWRYFAWSNQTLAVFTLWAATVWLAKNRMAYIITLLPAIFMTAVSVTYILHAPNEGLGLDLPVALAVAFAIDVVLLIRFATWANRCRKAKPLACKP